MDIEKQKRIIEKLRNKDLTTLTDLQIKKLLIILIAEWIDKPYPYDETNF